MREQSGEYLTLTRGQVMRSLTVTKGCTVSPTPRELTKHAALTSERV